MDAMRERRPDPWSAATPAEFLDVLKRLRAWAGRPSLRTMTALAGTVDVPGRPPNDLLPVGTLSDNLEGKRLPYLSRESFVEAYVRACLRASGADDTLTAEVVDDWCAARNALAAAVPAEHSAPDAPPTRGEWRPDAAPTQGERRDGAPTARDDAPTTRDDAAPGRGEWRHAPAYPATRAEPDDATPGRGGPRHALHAVPASAGPRHAAADEDDAASPPIRPAVPDADAGSRPDEPDAARASHVQRWLGAFRTGEPVVGRARRFALVGAAAVLVALAVTASFPIASGPEEVPPDRAHAAGPPAGGSLSATPSTASRARTTPAAPATPAGHGKHSANHPAEHRTHPAQPSATPSYPFMSGHPGSTWSPTMPSYGYPSSWNPTFP